MVLFPPIYQLDNGTPRDLSSLLALKSQGFGENVAYYNKPPFNTMGHSGIDWPCSIGTPIYASHDGVVSAESLDVNRGEGIVLSCADGYSLYWHMSKPLLTPGTPVRAGQIIGLSGNTGYSTAPHLHFEWRPNPQQTNNGFFGAVDPTPFLVWRPLQSDQDIMDQQTVTWLYDLAFNRQPTTDELAFWVGKDIHQFLKQAIMDRASFLSAQVQ